MVGTPAGRATPEKSLPDGWSPLCHFGAYEARYIFEARYITAERSSPDTPLPRYG